MLELMGIPLFWQLFKINTDKLWLHFKLLHKNETHNNCFTCMKWTHKIKLIEHLTLEHTSVWWELAKMTEANQIQILFWPMSWLLMWRGFMTFRESPVKNTIFWPRCEQLSWSYAFYRYWSWIEYWAIFYFDLMMKSQGRKQTSSWHCHSSCFAKNPGIIIIFNI